MNHPCDTYLKTYSAVNKIDQTLLGYDINYHCWKWWHAPVRHANAIVMSMAYNINVQCSEGGVDPSWQVMPVSSAKFKQELSLQMVQHKAANQMYPGDERTYGATQQNKHRCISNECSIVNCNNNIKRVSYERYEQERKYAEGKSQDYVQGTWSF